MATQWMIAAIDAAFKDQLGGDVTAQDLRIQLIGTSYTFSSAHQYMSDVGANKVGTAVALAGEAFSAGTLDATSPVSYGATSAIAQGAYIYIHTGSDATSRLLVWIDGKTRVVMAAQASAGATSLVVEPLPGPIPSGTTFTIGGQSVTTSGTVAADARAIPVNATGGIIAAGSIGEANAGQGWPVPINPGGVDITFAGAPNKIARIVV